MEIDLKDNKLKALCEQERLAQRKLGKQMAQKLKARLADRVRDKLEALEITEEDITDAVAWVR